MGQIIGGAAKPKRCNLNKLSQLETPAAGEYILVSSDNSMNAAGQGNFDCYIVGDGHKAATALPLKNIMPLSVFDLSAYTGSTYVDIAAALNAMNALPAAYKKGGMSVKFVQSSDNKYVQYRLMANEWNTNTDDWAIADEGVYIENPEFLYVKTDAEGKILWAIKADGGIYYGAGVPQQIIDYVNEKISDLNLDEIVAFLSDYLGGGTTLKAIIDGKVDKEEGKSLIDAEYAASQSVIENSEWLEVKTDSENRILEGIKTDGTKVVEGAIETPSAITYSTQSSEWLDVTVDDEDKIIEGTRSNGKKYINEFDNETKDSIRNLVSEVVNECDIFSIPNLNASFSTPLKYKVYNGSIEDDSVKGTENAKYVFNLDVKDSWIVRFKFRITENLLNQNKNADVASIDGAKVTAKVFQLTQHQETYTFEDVEYTENWPTVDGGIAFNQDVLDNKLYGRNLGQQAFSIKYIGSGDEVTIENDGSGLIITIDGTATTYNFSSYANMNELFAALSSDTDLELQYIALDKRLCNELAKFGPVHLKSTFYTDENGTYGSNMNIQPHIDCAPFYLYYAISDKWHQVEIFKIGNKIYSACDGNVTQTTVSQNSGELTLGGDCGVLFKDFVFCGDGVLDTEFINNKVVSSVSPYIIIFECHGMYDGAAYTATPAQTEGGMSSLNPDTLEYYYSILDSKGYLPVSMDDIAEFYTNGKPLPKRCYVHTFDDARWPVCFNLKFRSVYRKHGAKPAIVLITDYNTTITYNGSTITEEEAVKICHNAGFSIVSHTKDHRDIPRGTKPSQYIEYFTNDVIDGDLKQADGSIIVYPGGQSNTYSHDVMEYLGIRLGIQITQSMSITNLSKSRFSLSRINIGRTIKTDGTPIDYMIYTNNII